MVKAAREAKVPVEQPLPKEDEKEVKRKLPKLITSDVLAEIHKDIEDVVLPSWLRPAPKNLGEKGHGKLSADQWRVLATVHLPITLIRIWSHYPASDRRTKALWNFMSLTCAILIGTSRCTTKERREHYTAFMQNYLQGLLDQSLYSNVKLAPNHHISLHLSEFLERFGPVHSYWTFPFERFIGLLRNVNLNRKQGMLFRPIALVLFT